MIETRIEDAHLDERLDQEEDLLREFDRTDRIAESISDPTPDLPTSE